MSAIVTSIIAVTGTLLGSLMTYLLQRRSIERSERFARTERLRGEQIKIYSDFARMVLDFRRAQRRAWAERAKDKNSEAFRTAEDEVLRARAAGWTALYQVELITEDVEIRRLANRAMELAGSMNKAESTDAVKALTPEVRAAVENFVRTAGVIVRKV
ncbi:hypothetical protein [Nonomuraea sp. C10]|uniref:hypothetical protein n=1 Tax=Nonomuraea sp. C10 TaxID=2600577 RepID=UPI0011CE950E|nr:hypothetical protein [Nonomuraea sp. C10]TXK35616.1 hypothetical protein FR742_41195 [Nonomuraea sp. C10]